METLTRLPTQRLQVPLQSIPRAQRHDMVTTQGPGIWEFPKLNRPNLDRKSCGSYYKIYRASTKATPQFIETAAYTMKLLGALGLVRSTRRVALRAGRKEIKLSSVQGTGKTKADIS